MIFVISHFSIVDLQTCTPDELLPGVLDHVPIDEIDKSNADYRQYERIHSLFAVSVDETVNILDYQLANRNRLV